VQALDASHEEVFGERPGRDVTRWFSDASVSRYGIATVNYGTSTGLLDTELGENLDIEGSSGRPRCTRGLPRGCARERRAEQADSEAVEVGARRCRRRRRQRLRAPRDPPAPVDDGAADHLEGWRSRRSSWSRPSGRSISPSSAGAPYLYVYPRTDGRAADTSAWGRDPGRTRVHTTVLRLPRPLQELRAMDVRVRESPLRA
jgi:hypothetical protein